MISEFPQTAQTRAELRTAKEKLTEVIKKLGETEGWRQLSEYQQKTIEHSLYIQSRAERTSDPASSEAVSPGLPGIPGHESTRIASHEQMQKLSELGEGSSNPEDRAYKHSQNHVANWYCHAAIWNLEHEKPLTVKSPATDSIENEFFRGEYFIPRSYIDVIKQVKNTGFPAVVHIARQPPPMTLLQTHTCLALGTDDKGDIIVWEKEGENLPYRLNTITNVYKTYGKMYHWGTRKFETQK